MLLEYAMKSEVRMRQFQDPITLRVLNDQESRAEIWSKMWQSFLDTWRVSSIHEACNGLYVQLTETGRGEGGQAPMVPLCPHAPDSFLSDHALLTSAIAYCLAYDDQDLAEADRQLLQLATLSHEIPDSGNDEVAIDVDLREQLCTVLSAIVDTGFLKQAWRLLDQQGGSLVVAAEKDNSLTVFANQQPRTGDRRLDLLWYAHLVASQPLFNQRLAMLGDQPGLDVVNAKEDFQDHPLTAVPAQWNRIGMVHGGATKIKEYVFESAKLPEIRGASALLDRLNLLDTRALFGDDNQRSDTVEALIDAPECVIYANGGDVLALVPASMAQALAEAIERRYVEETLTAQCVAVAGTYSLLELQYGLAPTNFWAGDYLALLKAGNDQEKKLLHGYYGAPKEGETDEQLFHLRKSFGELTTELALKRFWRREGNEGPWLAHPTQNARSLAHFETLPFGQRCSSCDRRIATEKVQVGADTRVVCDACKIKLSLGRRQKVGWAIDFERFLDQNPDTRRRYLRNASDINWENIHIPQDLDQIGQAATPSGFIGLIYADGNNVGALIERIRTAGFYRQFASRLFEATQAAVFTALAEHLQPENVQDDQGQSRLIHPFEIVSIGGDDLLLIVPADKALPIALDIARFIEDAFLSGDIGYRDRAGEAQRYRKAEFKAAGRPVISLSAGVVLAQKNNPIFFLQDMVEELLKSAKGTAKRLKKEHGYTGGTVDFMALKSVTMVTSSIGEFRQTALRHVRQGARSASRDVLHLTARPYTLHEMSGLLRTTAALQQVDFPRSQLYHLRQELPKGRMLSILSYLYFTSRLEWKKAARVREALDHSWHGINDPAPWRHRGKPSECQDGSTSHDWETIFADLIEIYDFVRNTDQEE